MLGRCVIGEDESVTATRNVGPYRVYRVEEPKTKRITRLVFGLWFFGVALGLSVEADLGVNPWTVFHQGLAEILPISIGTAIIVTGLVILMIFPIIDEPIGIGTLLNITLIGIFVDITLAVLPDLESLPVRILALGVAPILIGVGSGFYIGAGLGPGPRDGIMTALTGRGLRVAVARTVVEASALIIGIVLGGRAGWGTLYMAGTVGFWVQTFLRRLSLDT